MIMYNQNMVKMKTFVIWTQRASLFMLKQMIFYKDTVDVETRSDTSNFELDRLLLNTKNKQVIWLMKDELGGQIMKRLPGLRATTYMIKNTKKEQISVS